MDVARKLGWTSAPDFLIGLGHGPDALRPFDVRVNCQPPNHGALPERTNDCNPPLAQGRATRIAQMTHHLMRSHPAPPAFAPRRERLDPSQDFRPCFRMQQSPVLHLSHAVLPWAWSPSVDLSKWRRGCRARCRVFVRWLLMFRLDPGLFFDRSAWFVDVVIVHPG